MAGTANVLAAGPSRVVLASSAAVYGAWPANPLPLGEAHPPRPNPACAYAVQKLAVEQLCTAGVPSVILRIGAVLGAHADRAIAASVAGYRRVVPAVRSVTQAVQFLDEADVVAALLAAGRAGSGVGPLLNVAPPDWLSAADIARISGGRVVALPGPALLGVAEIGRRLRLLPFGADRAVLLGGPLALDPAAAGAELGWQARWSSADVLAAALART